MSSFDSCGPKLQFICTIIGPQNKELPKRIILCHRIANDHFYFMPHTHSQNVGNMFARINTDTRAINLPNTLNRIC